MGRLSRDKRDVFYRRAKETGYRARSAFKLLQLDAEFNLLGNCVANTKDDQHDVADVRQSTDNDGVVVVQRAVDLCAAPGSWSQVLADRLYTREELEVFQQATEGKNENETSATLSSSNYRIVAVDLQPMAPIDGVVCLQGDITSLETAKSIVQQFQGHRAELVVCDGAPDVTGLHDLDEFLQGQLLLSAVKITTHVLCDGGTFVAKIFRGRSVSTLYAQLRLLFDRVSVAKPTSSRNSSLEAFVVCQNFKGGPCCNLPLDNNSFSTLQTSAILSEHASSHADSQTLHPSIIPFVACGDLSGWEPPAGSPAFDLGVLDADKSYPMAPSSNENDVLYIAPLVPPIKPPYETSMARDKEERAKKPSSR
jgi:tRNA (cytidine32/guanosine34-2'-O)-methyltransferase